jgi:nucleoside-diphosphate-sugar epimerase
MKIVTLAGKRVLVVGGSGFIGAALVRRLLKLKAEVSSIGKRNDGKVKLEMAGHRVVDIQDHVALAKVISDQEYNIVINAAGYVDHSPYLQGGINVINTHYLGNMNLIDLCYRPCLQRFIYIGSSDEYGLAPSPQQEDLREAPITPYAAAKTGATHLIQTLARTEGFPGVVVRLFLVYGPGQAEYRFLPQVITGCLQNREVPATKGEQLRDFCFIEDVIDGLLLSAVKHEALGQLINIASGKAISIRNMINKVVGIIGKGRPNFGAYPYRLGENMSLYASIKRAKEILGWEPITTLDEGLKKTVSWYEKNVYSQNGSYE